MKKFIAAVFLGLFALGAAPLFADGGPGVAVVVHPEMHHHIIHRHHIVHHRHHVIHHPAHAVVVVHP